MSDRVIGIGEWTISDNPEDKIITYALGSCVALIVYARNHNIGAMAHIALPSSQIDPARADTQPAYFADRAVQLVLDAFASRNIPPKALEIKLVGGAQMLDPNGVFDIGRRNVLEIKKLLWQNMLAPRAEDVGGSISRTVSLFIRDGTTLISSQNQKYEI